MQKKKGLWEISLFEGYHTIILVLKLGDQRASFVSDKLNLQSV